MCLVIKTKATPFIMWNSNANCMVFVLKADEGDCVFTIDLLEMLYSIRLHTTRVICVTHQRISTSQCKSFTILCVCGLWLHSTCI